MQRIKIIDLGASTDPARTLPPISEYPLTVSVRAEGGRRPFASSIKREGSRKGTDGWPACDAHVAGEVAERFNAKAAKTAAGKRAGILPTAHRVRSAERRAARSEPDAGDDRADGGGTSPAGTCHDYIASGKRYVPDGYSRSCRTIPSQRQQTNDRSGKERAAMDPERIASQYPHLPRLHRLGKKPISARSRTEYSPSRTPSGYGGRRDDRSESCRTRGGKTCRDHGTDRTTTSPRGANAWSGTSPVL